MNNFNGFQNTPALGDHILNYEDFLAALNFKAAPQNQLVILLFRKNKARAPVSRDFLANDESANGRGDDRNSLKFFNFFGQRAPELLNHGHLLQRQGTLKKLPAVQPTTQNKMPFEEGAGIPKNIQNVFLSHADSLNIPGDFGKFYLRGRRSYLICEGDQVA